MTRPFNNADVTVHNKDIYATAGSGSSSNGAKHIWSGQWACHDT